jgi:hypothetical protein
MKIIINELKRNVSLEVIIQRNFIENPKGDSKIVIRVENYEEGTVYYWNTETFHNRYDLMKDMFNRYNDDELDIYDIKNEDDPLWDAPVPSLLGYAFYKLEPVAYLMSNVSEIGIISPKGTIMGELTIDIIPHDDNGNEYDEVPDQPNELIGQSLNYTVSIIKVKDLPENFCKNFQVEYQTFYDNSINKTKIYNNEEDKKRETSFEINENFEHKIDYLTKDDIEYFEKDKLGFKVYAYEEVEKKGKTSKEEILKMYSNEPEVKEEKKEEKKEEEKTKEEFSAVNKAGKTKENKNSEIKKDNCMVF